MSGTDPLAGSEETTFAPGGLTHQAFRAGSPG